MVKQTAPIQPEECPKPPHERGLSDLLELHLAAGQGRLEVVIVLVKADADVNAIASRDATPISIATSKGHTEIVKILKEHGAK